jgi:hypothetical protein
MTGWQKKLQINARKLILNKYKDIIGYYKAKGQNKLSTVFRLTVVNFVQ